MAVFAKAIAFVLGHELGTQQDVVVSPALPREVLTYGPAHRERLVGLPGLTCTWQVSGRAEIPFEDQVVLDVEYLRTRNFVHDMKIIARTIPAVISARGAY